MQLPWREIDAVNNIMRPLNFDFVESFKLQCLRPMNFFDGLFVTVFASTCALLAVPVTTCGILGMRELSFHFKRRQNTARSQRIRAAFVNRSWNVFLLFLFLAFPPITKRAFNTFRCEPMEPDSSYRNGYALYLTADLSIKCFQGQHVFWVAFSGAAACVYTLGIPVFMATILYTNHRKLLLQTPHCIRRYGFLYSKYEDHAWYWELVEMARKTFFGCVIMFWASGTATQIVIAMFAAFGFLILHLKCEAYKDATDSGLQTLSMTAIFLTLWIGLLAKTNLLDELQSETERKGVYFIFTLIVNCLPLFGFAIAVLLMVGHAYAQALEQARQRIGKKLESKGYKTLHRLLIQGRRSTVSTRKADAISVALQAHVGKKANIVGSSWLARAKSAKDADSLDSKYAAEAADRRRMLTRQRTAGGHDRQAAIRQRAVLAREGKPHVKHDRQRYLYLVRVRLSRESIVLRHWPIGKGFIARIPAGGGSGVVVVEEGRPPYIFIKAWSIVGDGRTGFVYAKYDVRDSGFKLERDDIVTHPEEANKLLLVWEQKKLIGGVRRASSIMTKASILQSKLASGEQRRESSCSADVSQQAAKDVPDESTACSAASEGASASLSGVGGGLLGLLKAKGLVGASNDGNNRSRDHQNNDERSELKQTDELEPKAEVRSAPPPPRVDAGAPSEQGSADAAAGATETTHEGNQAETTVNASDSPEPAGEAVAPETVGAAETSAEAIAAPPAHTNNVTTIAVPPAQANDVTSIAAPPAEAHDVTAIARAEGERDEAIAKAKAAEEQIEALRQEVERAHQARDQEALADRNLVDAGYMALEDELEGIILGSAPSARKANSARHISVPVPVLPSSARGSGAVSDEKVRHGPEYKRHGPEHPERASHSRSPRRHRAKPQPNLPVQRPKAKEGLKPVASSSADHVESRQLSTGSTATKEGSSFKAQSSKEDWRMWRQDLRPSASAEDIEQAAAVKAKARIAAAREEADALRTLQALDALNTQEGGQHGRPRDDPRWRRQLGEREQRHGAHSKDRQHTQERVASSVAVMSPQEREKWEYELKMKLWQQQQWEGEALEALMPGATTQLRDRGGRHRGPETEHYGRFSPPHRPSPPGRPSPPQRPSPSQRPSPPERPSPPRHHHGRSASAERVSQPRENRHRHGQVRSNHQGRGYDERPSRDHGRVPRPRDVPRRMDHHDGRQPPRARSQDPREQLPRDRNALRRGMRREDGYLGAQRAPSQSSGDVDALDC